MLIVLQEIFAGVYIIFFFSSRYHNGRRLQELTVRMRSSLFIANVNGAQGLYTCKATNDYGSEMSSAGELKIRGNTIFTKTTEIHARSLANFTCQYADRHIILKFMRHVSERERAIRQFVIVKNKLMSVFKGRPL